MSEKITLQLMINDETQHLTIDPRVTLLDALREHLQLTGTKKGAIRVNVVLVLCT